MRTAQLAIGVELIRHILSEVNAAATIRSKTNDDVLRTLRRRQFHASNERRGIGQQVFTITFNSGHVELPCVKHTSSPSSNCIR